jgi:hypothetical protein
MNEVMEQIIGAVMPKTQKRETKKMQIIGTAHCHVTVG